MYSWRSTLLVLLQPTPPTPTSWTYWELVSSPFRPTLVNFLRPDLLHSVLPPPLIWRFPPRSGDSPLHHLTLNRSLSLHRKIHLFNTSCDEVSFVLFHQNFENICSSNHQIITQSLRVRSFVFCPFP